MSRWFTTLTLLFLATGIFAKQVDFSDPEQVEKYFNTINELMYSDSDSALFLNGEIYKYSLDEEIDTLLLKSTFTFGKIYIETGNHLLAIEYFTKAIDLMDVAAPKEIPPWQYDLLMRTYNNMGVAYFSSQMTDLAMHYFTKSLDLLWQIQAVYPDMLSLRYRMVLQFNIGGVYLEMDELEKAKVLLDEVAVLNRDLQDSLVTPHLLINLGIYYQKSNVMDSAIHYYRLGKDHFEKSGDPLGLAKAHNNLGDYFEETGEYEKAIDHYLKARDAGIRAHEWRSVNISNNGLRSLYAKTGNYQEAYYFSEQAIEVMEEKIGVYESDKARQLVFQYEFDEKLKLDTTKLEDVIGKQQLQKLIFIALIVLLFLIALIILGILLYFRNKHRISEVERQNLQLRNEQMKQMELESRRELEIKNRELVEKAMYELHKNEFIKDIAKQVLAIKENLPAQYGDELDNLEKIIRKESEMNIWKELEVRFRESHPRFNRNLTKNHPYLTSNQKKLAIFLRMNLTTKDIASITRQSPDSIKVARSRLRKKLGLSSQENIVTFLEKLG
jgi:tetratricopeptide (TPR) repeat protein